MKLADLTQLDTIDGQITDLHSELARLYQRRATLLRPKDSHNSTDYKTPVIAGAVWLEETYDQLKEAWLRYDIAIPSLKSLQKQLLKARDVMNYWEKSNPIFAGNVSILLVPPTKLYGSPVMPTLRKQQRLLQSADVVDPGIKLPGYTKKWRVIVVYSAQAGIPFNELTDIFGNSSYQLLGKKVCDLGLSEYSALTLQLSQPIDTRSWTILLRLHTDTNRPAPSAHCQQRYYRFTQNEIWGIMPDDRFRPALEIV